MSSDVGQTLLGDAIANQLDVRLEAIRLRRNVFDDDDSGRLRELTAQCVERAVQSEVFQRIRTQPARDAAHFIEPGAHRLLCIGELATDLRWGAVDGAFQEQQRDGQRLTDLIVQLARNPLALVLLRRQRGRVRRRPFGLQHGSQTRSQQQRVRGQHDRQSDDQNRNLGELDAC